MSGEGRSFTCDKCRYTTTRLSSWKKHLETKKHRGVKKTDNESFECECGRQYAHRQSLSLHKRTCDGKEASSGCKAVAKAEDLVTVPSNLLSELMALVKKTKVGTTNIVNLRIDNLNVFLSQNCGNAMSMQDFTKSLSIQREELSRLSDPAVDRPAILSDIIARGLAPLDLTRRPVHCTESDVWYIKDHTEGWGEDPDKNRLIKEAEASIQKKATAIFEKMYPQWMHDDRLQQVYTSLLSGLMSDTPKNSEQEIRDRIAEMVRIANDVTAIKA